MNIQIKQAKLPFFLLLLSTSLLRLTGEGGDYVFSLTSNVGEARNHRRGESRSENDKGTMVQV